MAYFLYRYRNEISAENFLIISPNGIFVDYISGVLPELGEESVRSLGMERAVLLTAEGSIAQVKGRLGIICKGFSQAEALYRYLKENLTVKEQIHLLTPDSQEFYEGVTVMSAAMSKGLEFDEVMITDADDVNYHTEYERGLLYVACTRAMHRLTVVYSGAPSRFLPA